MYIYALFLELECCLESDVTLLFLWSLLFLFLFVSVKGKHLFSERYYWFDTYLITIL